MAIIINLLFHHFLFIEWLNEEMEQKRACNFKIPI